MTNTEIKEDILEESKELEKLLTDRISELFQLAGTKQGQLLQGERHSFCYYRDFVWKIRDLAKQINEVKK